MIYQKTIFEKTDLDEVSLFIFRNHENICVDTEWVYGTDGDGKTNFSKYIIPIMQDFEFVREYYYTTLEGEHVWLDMTKRKQEIPLSVDNYRFDTLIGDRNVVDLELVGKYALSYLMNDEGGVEKVKEMYSVDPVNIPYHFTYQPNLTGILKPEVSGQPQGYNVGKRFNFVSDYHREKKVYSFRLNSLKEIPTYEPLYSEYKALNPGMSNPDDKNMYVEYYPTTVYPNNFPGVGDIQMTSPGKDTVIVYLPNIYTRELDSEMQESIVGNIDIFAETGKFLVFLNGVMVDYTVVDTDTPLTYLNGTKGYKRIAINGYGNILKRRYFIDEDGRKKSYRDDTIDIYFWENVKYVELKRDPVYTVFRYSLSLFRDRTELNSDGSPIDSPVTIDVPSIFYFSNEANNYDKPRKISAKNCIVVRNGMVLQNEADYRIRDNMLLTNAETGIQELDDRIMETYYDYKEEDVEVVDKKYDETMYRTELQDYVNDILSQKVLFFYDSTTLLPVIIDQDDVNIKVNEPYVGSIITKNFDSNEPVFSGGTLTSFENVLTEPDGTASLDSESEYYGQKRTVSRLPLTDSVVDSMKEYTLNEDLTFEQPSKIVEFVPEKMRDEFGWDLSWKYFDKKMVAFKTDESVSFGDGSLGEILTAMGSSISSGSTIDIVSPDDTKIYVMCLTDNNPSSFGKSICRFEDLDTGTKEESVIGNVKQIKMSDIKSAWSYPLFTALQLSEYVLFHAAPTHCSQPDFYLIFILTVNGELCLLPYDIALYKDFEGDSENKVVYAPSFLYPTDAMFIKGGRIFLSGVSNSSTTIIFRYEQYLKSNAATMKSCCTTELKSLEFDTSLDEVKCKGVLQQYVTVDSGSIGGDGAFCLSGSSTQLANILAEIKKAERFKLLESEETELTFITAVAYRDSLKNNYVTYLFKYGSPDVHMGGKNSVLITYKNGTNIYVDNLKTNRLFSDTSGCSNIFVNTAEKTVTLYGYDLQRDSDRKFVFKFVPDDPNDVETLSFVSLANTNYLVYTENKPKGSLSMLVAYPESGISLGGNGFADFMSSVSESSIVSDLNEMSTTYLSMYPSGIYTIANLTKLYPFDRPLFSTHAHVTSIIIDSGNEESATFVVKDFFYESSITYGSDGVRKTDVSERQDELETKTISGSSGSSVEPESIESIKRLLNSGLYTEKEIGLIGQVVIKIMSDGSVYYEKGTVRVKVGNVFEDSITGEKKDRIVFDDSVFSTTGVGAMNVIGIRNYPRLCLRKTTDTIMLNTGFSEYPSFKIIDQSIIDNGGDSETGIIDVVKRDFDPFKGTSISRFRVFE